MTRREKIEQRLQEDPQDVFLNYSYAMELAKAGEIAEARERFAIVRSIDADYVPAYFQEAQMLASEGNNNEARRIVTEGIEVARRVGDSHALGEMTEFRDGLE